ncbi:MAG: DUF2752 domain-containing protein [Planctomycetota bacterium]
MLTSPHKAPVHERAIAGALAVACLAVLITAAIVEPSDRGHGTHERLGMPPCGWAQTFGQPCPTCGMTTAFANAADANWARALVVQPAGAAGAVAASMLFWSGIHVAAFGSRLGRVGARLLRPRWVWTGLAIGLAAWGYKIATWSA